MANATLDRATWAEVEGFALKIKVVYTFKSSQLNCQFNKQIQNRRRKFTSSKTAKKAVNFKDVNGAVAETSFAKGGKSLPGHKKAATLGAWQDL